MNKIMMRTILAGAGGVKSEKCRRKCMKDFKDSFVWLLNERKRNKDPG